MKKQAVSILAIVLLIGLLTGCGTGADNSGTQNGSSGNASENSAADAGSENETVQNNQGTGKHRMGLGVISGMKKAVDAGDTDGTAEIDTVIAAVTLDEEDRIVNCSIDVLEHVIPVSNTGVWGTPANTEFQTKKELGDSYGMRGASGIGKEWYEQAEAFEQQVVGMTLNDIYDIPTDEAGYAQGEAWTSSVTISITDFQAALTKAIENTQEK